MPQSDESARETGQPYMPTGPVGLVELFDPVTEQLRNAFDPLEVDIVATNGPLDVVPLGQLFVTNQTRVQYGATNAALDAADAYGNRFDFVVPVKGRILSISVVDQDDVIAAGTLSIYVSTIPFVAAASDAAFTISAADATNTVTVQAFGAMTDIGSARFLEVVDVDKEYATGPTGKLFCQLFTSGTPTPTAAGMPLVQMTILPLIG